MLAPVVVVHATTTVGEALRTMRQAGAAALVVEPLRPGDAYGIVTLRDVRGSDGNGGGLSLYAPVRGAMTVPPFVLAPTMRVEDGLSLLLSSQVHHAIVMRDGRPVGIVHDIDLFQAIEAGG